MFRKLHEGLESLPAPETQLNRHFNYTEPGTFRTNLPTPDKLSNEQLGLMNHAVLNSTQANLQEATNMAVNGEYGAPFMKGLANHFLGFRMPTTILELQSKCKEKTINDIIAGFDDSTGYNCGFIYDEKDDAFIANNGVGRGYLGSKVGPVIAPGMGPLPKGTYYWNAADAKKNADAAKCGTITGCNQLKGSMYANVCGWCGTSSRAIPINSSGQALYGSDPLLLCDPARIIKSTDSCPVDAKSVAQMDSTGQVCTDNKLSRDCIIKYARDAKCSDDGSLITALKDGTSATKYDDVLATNNAFMKYQQNAAVRLIPDMFNAGNATIDAVINNLQQLNTQAQPGNNTVTAFAARDLCLKKGELDKYDFCQELTDSTAGPFGLDCLQREFRINGGQVAGDMFPTEENRTRFYNVQFNTWLDVKNYIKKLKTDSSSANVAVQERALRQFLGVKRESLYNPIIKRYNNYEVYNFATPANSNDMDAIFIGRNIRPSGNQNDATGFPNFNTSFLGTNSQVMQIDNQTKTSFVILADLRPGEMKKVQFAFDTKDGVVMTINKDMNNYKSQMNVSQSDELRRNQSRAMTAYVYNEACTILNPNGNNRIKVYWNNQFVGGLKTFRMMYADCGVAGEQNTAKIIPKNWITMTQQLDAPMLSFEYTTSGFQEKRLPEFFPIEKSGVNDETRTTNFDSANTDLNKPNQPFIRFTGSSSSIRVNKLIRSNAISTITLVFNILNGVSEESVLTFGGFSIRYVKGSGLRFVVNGVNNTNPLQIPINTGLWHIAVIRVGGSNSFSRNKLNVDVFQLPSLLRSKSVSLTNRFIIEKLSNDILPMLTPQNNFVLGKNGTFNSPQMEFASLRVYDNEITNALVLADARNAFARNWYN